MMMRRLFSWLSLLLVSASGTLAWAHPGDLRVRPNAQELTMANLEVWFQWDFHPSIFGGTIGLIVLYILGVTKGRKKFSPDAKPVTRKQIGFFTAAMLIMYFSLDGPMHYMSDELSFAAHMAQHLMLQMIWAPLLILSLPSWILYPIVRHEPVARFGRWISHPAKASVLFLLTMSVWHIPELYDLALRVHAWHIVEHLVFMVTAVIFWWPITSNCPQVPRASLGGRLAMIFLNMFPMKALGLIIATSNALFYEFYAEQPRLFALTPLGDQRVGGLMMWILAGLPLWVALGALFSEWRKSDPATGLTGVPELDQARTSTSGA